MKIDINDFFRQVSTRILSELDIEKAMEKTLPYINQYIPTDEIIFALYDPETKIARTIASAAHNQEGMRIASYLIPEELRGGIEEDWKHFYGVEINNYNELDALHKWFNDQTGRLDYSTIYMTLDLTGERLGIIGLNKQKFIYTNQHAELLKVLHEPFAISMANALRFEEVVRLKEILDDDNHYLQSELKNITGEEIIGVDFGLKNTFELVRQVAPLTSPVLLLGESGVGKEVIANGIHSFSDRHDQPFIKVNCGAIPDTLIDSELFGHEKGSFTGATERKRGRFERAHKGTIFLDEIGELSQQAQVRLLRVLQNKEIERVGGSKTIPVDVRIIAATNRDLSKMVNEGSFREDLWFRINVFPILIPPLRSRLEDIPALTYYFIDKKAKEFKIYPSPKVAEDALECMKEYHWPGNVRELENSVERAIIRGKTGILRREHFYLPASDSNPKENKSLQSPFTPLDEMIKIHIQEVLNHTKGKIHGKEGAAEILKINPNTLRSKMRRLGIL